VFVITREEWVDIVSLHRQGLSIRAISARLGVSRNTVRAALRREGPPSRQARALPSALPSKLDPYRDYLLAPGRVPRALGGRLGRGDPCPGL